MTPVAIAYGANIGDRLTCISNGLAILADSVTWLGCSAVYETEPMYVSGQPMYLNGVAAGATSLGPVALVAALKRVEAEFGPRSSLRNSPRALDLDLIVYGNAILDLGGRYPVQVPHPLMVERRFVLDPLIEAWPGVLVPGIDLQLETHKESVRSQYMIRKADAPLRI